MALGTINHVALTLAEAARRGLPIAGCILSRTEPEIGAHEDGNVELIAALTGHRPLGVVPHLAADARDDDDRVADAVRDSARRRSALLGASGCSATTPARYGRRRWRALLREDHHAAEGAFALGLGGDVWVLRQRDVHDAPVVRAHRLDGNRAARS